MDRVVASSYVQIKASSTLINYLSFEETDSRGLEDPIQTMQRSIDQWRSSKVLDCYKLLHEDIAAFVKAVRSVDVNVIGPECVRL